MTRRCRKKTNLSHDLVEGEGVNDYFGETRDMPAKTSNLIFSGILRCPLKTGFTVCRSSTVKPVIRGHLNNPEKVPLLDRCPITRQVSLHDRCPLTRQVSLHDRCPYMTGVPTRQVSLHDRCPFMTGVPTRQVSLHDRCPYMTGVPT